MKLYLASLRELCVFAVRASFFNRKVRKEARRTQKEPSIITLTNGKKMAHWIIYFLRCINKSALPMTVKPPRRWLLLIVKRSRQRKWAASTVMMAARRSMVAKSYFSGRNGIRDCCVDSRLQTLMCKVRNGHVQAASEWKINPA